MRRHLAVLLLATGLTMATVAGCSSSGQPKQTLTQIVTVTGSGPASQSVTVIAPVTPTTTPAGETGTSSSGASNTATTGASGGSSSTAPTSSTATTSTAATSASTPVTTATGKVVKVNPLKVDCGQLLDAQDVKKVLGVSISTSVARIVDVANADIGRLGLIRCRYGASSGKDTAPVSVALSDYKTAAAAKAQLKKTVDSLGGTVSSTNVQGYPATVVIEDGGLLLMTYDTWTLSLAVADKVVPNTALPNGLNQLATMVLLRVLKTA